MDIQSTVFIVTGGASGLGEGAARMLAENGAKVVIADMQVEKAKQWPRPLGALLSNVMSAARRTPKPLWTPQRKWARCSV